MKEYIELPYTEEEDINREFTTWIDGKCVMLNEDNRWITYYIDHKVSTKNITDTDGNEKSKKIMLALSIRVTYGCGVEELKKACGSEAIYNEVLPIYSIDNLSKIKEDIIKQIEEYDKSKNVNSFYLQGYQTWVERDKRISMKNSLNDEKLIGRETSTIWLDEALEPIILPIDLVLEMLTKLEVYAYDCYVVTREHISEVTKMNNYEDLFNYDITKDYPPKLSF